MHVATPGRYVQDVDVQRYRLRVKVSTRHVAVMELCFAERLKGDDTVVVAAAGCRRHMADERCSHLQTAKAVTVFALAIRSLGHLRFHCESADAMGL